jgi:hypothetical protein
MTQNEINRAVAFATGECLCEVQRRGFSIADPVDVNFDPEPDDLPPSTIDWDEIDLHRNVAVVEQPLRTNRRLV